MGDCDFRCTKTILIRNPNNMAMLGEMFRVNPEKAAGALASVFLELLLQKDCYLRALRILLREIVR